MSRFFPNFSSILSAMYSQRATLQIWLPMQSVDLKSIAVKEEDRDWLFKEFFVKGTAVKKSTTKPSNGRAL